MMDALLVSIIVNNYNFGRIFRKATLKGAS
jgi:hypothetical protein